MAQERRRPGALVAENVGESAAACLVAMVQGNIMVVTAAHWAIAAQTGVVAGALASMAILFTRSTGRWRVAGLLAVVTGVVDYFVHPGMMGPGATEAVVTGMAAGGLSLVVGFAIDRMRGRRSGASA